MRFQKKIMQKLGFQVTSFTRKSRKYNSYKGRRSSPTSIGLTNA
jgi:hypothetical protein